MAMIPARAPARTESAPSSAPTVLCWMTFSGAGRAPERSSSARLLALLEGEVAGDLARAAGDRLLDDRAPRSPCCRARWRTACRRSRWWPGRSAGRPAPLKRKLTAGSVVLVERLRGAGQHLAGDQRAALDQDRRAAGLRPGRAAPGRRAARGRPWPPAAGTLSSTIWKVSLAVWPITDFSCCGSLSPGASTTMRSAPWRTMFGSLGAQGVDAAADDLDRLVDGLADVRWPGPGRQSELAVAGRRRELTDTSRPPPVDRLAELAQRRLRPLAIWAGSVIRTLTTPFGLVEAGERDLRVAQGLARFLDAGCSAARS